MIFHSGFVVIVGRPNVGKSTLVNGLVGEKVAITSDKPQTTRSAIRGVLNRESSQVVLIDTPGYHKPRTLLGRRLNQVVRSAWSDVDLALFVVDGKAGVGRGDQKVAGDLRAANCPVFCIVNKVDITAKDSVAVALASVSRFGDFDEFIPISALT
ncbi:MAG: GTPase Era, partial [Actinomycetota bacterium]|nr:GTPase Era [Actinomycetota bacterium]